MAKGKDKPAKEPKAGKDKKGKKGKAGEEGGAKRPKQKRAKVKGALLDKVTSLVLLLFLASLVAQKLTLS